MKNLDNFGFNELTESQLNEINGGASFPYRLGQFFRFMYVELTEGQYNAIIDLAVNESVNNTN